MKCRRLSRAELERLAQPLAYGEILSLSIAHADTLDAIAKGRGTSDTLWDFVSNALTWSRAAELMDVAVPEMHEQLLLAKRLLQHFDRTGRVSLDRADYDLAKYGVEVMDELAMTVTRGVALQAAKWCERQLAALRPAVQERRAA